MSRTGRGNMATLKPPTPLLAPNKGPMKPASPLRPKTAPKKPISHSQRRWRFQLAHLTGPQRRRRFQTTRPPGRQGQAAAPAGPEAMSSPTIAHLVPFTRAWARWHARGPSHPHVNPIICAWAAPPTRISRGLRAYLGVNAHVQGLTCEQHATTGTVVPKTQPTSHTTPRFQRSSPRWSALWAPYRRTSVACRHRTGEMASLEIRHAGTRRQPVPNAAKPPPPPT